MIIPKVSRKAAVILGKAAGALILTAIGGTVSWLLDRERKRIQAEAVRTSEEPELVIELPREVEPETPEPEPGMDPDDDEEA